MDLEEQSQQAEPDIQLARKKFYLSLPDFEEDEENSPTALLEIIKERNMTPWYIAVCQDLNWILNIELLKSMKTINDNEINEFNKNIEYAKNNLCVVDLRDAFLQKAHYYAFIGDKDNSIATFSRAYSLTIALGYKLDNVLTCIRIGLFHLDHSILSRYFDMAEDLIKMGADYDRINKLKVYQGVYRLIIRDFTTATNKFLSVVPTFGCYELLDYNSFIKYTVYSSVLTLPRNILNQKVIQGSEILEALHNLPEVKKYAFSLYEGNYADFFKCLADVEEFFRRDYFLNPHYRYYVKEMKILAYTQLLSSYQSLHLKFISEQFNVSKEFIENDLTKFIGSGRIKAKIDKTTDIVNINTDKALKKQEYFDSVIRDGDELLTRLHKVSRVVDGWP